MFNNLSDRSKIILQLLFFVVFGLVVFGLLNNVLSSRSDNGSHLLRFEVEASGGFATITLRAGSSSITTPTTVTSPWTKTIRIKSDTEVYLTASNPSQIGDISCRILLDKVVWKTEKISTPKNGVACAGIVP
jgi:hypothetical protein